MFLIAFRVLTSRDVSTRDVVPGALVAGVGFWVLQGLSSLIISRYLQHAQKTYGNFATVITLLWWFYLTRVLTVFGAQLNVVLRSGSGRRVCARPPDPVLPWRATGKGRWGPLRRHAAPRVAVDR